MSCPSKIRIFVDDLVQTEIKGVLSVPELKTVLYKMVDIDFTVLQQNIGNLLNGILAILSNSTSQSEDFEIQSVNFTVNINASGEVSLVSLAKGAIAGQTGIGFTIVRRSEGTSKDK